MHDGTDSRDLARPAASEVGVGCAPTQPYPSGRIAEGIGDRSPSARRVSLVAGAHALDPGPRTSSRPAGPLGVGTLVDIATGLAAAEGLWRPHVSHDPLSRTSVRLVATPAYEVWLLGWAQGQGVDLHDHGGANAAFVVLEGELTELTLHDTGIDTVRLRAGAVGTVPAGAVHDVVNRTVAPATSIHVYADPLRTMTFYDAHGTPTFTELVQEVPALLSSAGTARALHPARPGA
jgi:quercetin dioxygenase-like cupin family protein